MITSSFFNKTNVKRRRRYI